MKKILYLVLVYPLFIACQEQKDSQVEKKVQSIEVHKQALKKDGQGKPPTDNPIMKLFLTKNIDLIQADKIYRENIVLTKDRDYLDNLRQYGFKSMISSGLIEKGTKEQKEYYINEQLSCYSNLPNFSEFYALLESSTEIFTKQEIMNFSNNFYSKNLSVIENEITFPSEEAKKQKILDLKQTFKIFQRKIFFKFK